MEDLSRSPSYLAMLFPSINFASILPSFVLAVTTMDIGE